MLFFKHEGYKNEDEYRFLQMFGADKTVPNVKHRTRPYALVKYREFDWRAVAPNALKRIVMGPAADELRNKLFAKDCLQTSRYTSVPDDQIVTSDIPYRAT